MDLSDWISIIALLTGVFAMLAAFRANKMSRQANDLQTKIDERGREFRDVSWEVDFEPKGDAVRVVVTNAGLTPAIATTLVIEDGRTRTLINVGDVMAGGESIVELPYDDPIMAAVIAHGMTNSRTSWLMHWSSPLGEVSQHRQTGLQLF